MKPLKTWVWASLLCALFFLSLTAWLCLSRQGAGGVAEIRSDGELLYTLPLDVPGQWVIPAPNGGSNTVTVADGKISVTHATCPDQYCVARGAHASGTDIICLPNRLVIHFTAAPEVDAALG